MEQIDGTKRGGGHGFQFVQYSPPREAILETAHQSQFSVGQSAQRAILSKVTWVGSSERGSSVMGMVQPD